MIVCIMLLDNLDSPRAVVNSSVSETKPSVDTPRQCKQTNIVMFIFVIKMVTKIFVFAQFVCSRWH